MNIFRDIEYTEIIKPIKYDYGLIIVYHSSRINIEQKMYSIVYKSKFFPSDLSDTLDLWEKRSIQKQCYIQLSFFVEKK